MQQCKLQISKVGIPSSTRHISTIKANSKFFLQFWLPVADYLFKCQVKLKSTLCTLIKSEKENKIRYKKSNHVFCPGRLYVAI